MIHLDRAEARRIAVRAQLLDARPQSQSRDLLGVLERLTFVQLDPTAAIAPSADLVLWTRLGSAYQPEMLVRALAQERSVFELSALVRPMSDLRLFRAGMKAAPRYAAAREWLVANDQFRRDILARLADAGPLLSRDIPDTCAVPWPSSGWTNSRNVTQMLELLTRCGQIAIAGRRGRQRLWDVAERVYPGDVDEVPLDEAERLRDARRLTALGIARATAAEAPMEPTHVGEAGVPATVEGVAGTWRVDPEAVGQPFAGRTAVLSPFDRLIHDRVRAMELFDFEYTLEMYKPKAQRRWGYFALPVLHHDRLVGKVDAAVDRRRKTLDVNVIHEDIPFTSNMRDAVREELELLAGWLGVQAVFAGDSRS